MRFGNDWMRSVLIAEGLEDWTICYCSGGDYCWRERKQIDLHTASPVTPARFLHEVAHALFGEPEGEHKNHYHGGGWADKFGELVDKYLTVK